ncbi:MAG: RNA polymerase sigma factor RpoD/SigA [Chitinophagales bacterium]|nr:RNA polymerase sigma factor RpoD/SigA [Chitinophagales bacterium]
MRQLKITNHITQRDNQSLERYLSEIAKEALLTDDQEVDLAKRIREGDPMALEKMVKANLRFVVSVAKQYQNQGLQLSDLINEGNLGLIKAAQKFDETRGFKFISYAVWWIRQSVLQALVEQSRIIRLPLNKVGSYNKITRTMYEFEQKYQREPSNEELEDILKINKREIDEIIRGAHKHVSMDAPFASDDEDQSSLYDVIQDEDASGSDKQMIKESLKIEIKKALNVLPKRDAEIVSCYFGLKGEVHMTLEEIGKQFDLTRERVRQIKERSLRRLRKTTTSMSLKTYLGE